jgi:short-subunit dehydrogenase/uncharacterized protein (DUF2062 family)
MFIQSFYRKLTTKIRSFRGNPRQIARSFALGSFIGVSPLVGMQVLISLGLSLLFRLNKTAAVAGVLNTNWTKGLMLYPLNYKIGAWLLGLHSTPDIRALFQGNIFRNLTEAGSGVFFSLLAGGMVTGLIIATVYYHLILRIFKTQTINQPLINTPMNNSSEKYALITGASQGLGKAIACELASQNINLLLVSLEGEGLEQLRNELREQYLVDVQYFETDFKVQESVYEVAEWAIKQGPISILINNAGIGGTKAFENASPDYLDTIIQVNVRAMTMLTRLLLPELKKQEKAYILNVASMASFSPFAYKTVYPASKAFVYSFSRGLYEELKRTNVFVSVIHPGPIKTNADVTARIEKQGWKGKMGLVTPERIARIAIRQLFKRDSLILPGFLNKINWTLMAILPNAWKLPLLSQAVRKEITTLPPVGLQFGFTR